MLSVVVTGASGFIGQHVVARLRQEGAAVTAVVRREDAPLPAEVRRVVIPEMDGPGAQPTLRSVLADADAVVHLAGRAHQIRDRATDPLEAFRRGNVAPTRALLDAVAGSAVRRIVLLSTVAAAATTTTEAVGDDVVPAPGTPYGISKREMELLAQEAAAGGVQPVIFRPPLVYGPGMKGNPLRLLRLVAARRPVPVSVPPARRSTIYVGNLAQAISLALRHPGIGARPYFVSDGEAPTTLEFIEAMANALRVRPRIVHVPRSLLQVMGRAGDAVSRIVPFPFTSYEVGRLTAGVEIESTRFWQAVGAAPEHSIGDGMAATATWFRSIR